MHITITTDYAIRTVIYLAIRKKITVSAQISKAMDIPKSYVLVVGRKLRNGGIIKAVRGKDGGLILIKPPSEISIYDIALLTEKSLKINKCLENDLRCSRDKADICPVKGVYTKLQNEIEEKMKVIFISNLIQEEVNKGIGF